MNTALHFSSGKDNWQTPPELFAQLHAEFAFTADAACTPETALPVRTQIYDGLGTDWSEDGDYRDVRVYVNPPYSRGLQAKFIAKAAAEAQRGALVVMLLPARTDTKAFHAHIWDEHRHQPRAGVEVRFLRGRLRFVGAPSNAPFPSMIVVFRGATSMSAPA